MNPERIGDNLTEIPEWTTESQGEAIVRTYHLLDFEEAIRFVNEVASLAVSAGHLPTVNIYENQVKVRLTTPQADGLSEIDFALAKDFDHLAGEPLIH